MIPTNRKQVGCIVFGDTLNRRAFVREQVADALLGGGSVRIEVAKSDQQPAWASGLVVATNGFWQNAEWLPCTDGKVRAVEPGTFPLAHGATARVGRLRAYGNAVCAPVAAEFIRAYLEKDAEK